MIFRAASFGTYSQMTRAMQHRNGHNKLSAADLLIAGAVTGLVISFIEVVTTIGFNMIRNWLLVSIYQTYIGTHRSPENKTPDSNI
jgi:hypothetical protein